MCSCGSEPETTAHFLLRFKNYANNRSKLLKNVYSLDQTLRNYDDYHLIHKEGFMEKSNFNINKK